jgi:hypothetical protein
MRPKWLAVGEDVGLQREKGAAGVDEVDAGKPVLLGDLLRAQVLLHGEGEVGAAFHGRVVGDDITSRPAHAADAGDEAGRGRGAVVHPQAARAPISRKGAVDRSGPRSAPERGACLCVMAPHRPPRRRTLAHRLEPGAELGLELVHVRLFSRNSSEFASIVLLDDRHVRSMPRGVDSSPCRSGKRFKVGLDPDGDVAAWTRTSTRPWPGSRRRLARTPKVVCLPELYRSPYFCQSEDARLFDLAENLCRDRAPRPGARRHRQARRGRRDRAFVRAARRRLYHNYRRGDRRHGRCWGRASTARCTSPTIPRSMRSSTSPPGDLGFRRLRHAQPAASGR